MFIFFLISVCLFLAAVGLHCYTRAFSSCGEQGLLSSCRKRASHGGGLSHCRSDSRAWAPGLSYLSHVGPSLTRDRTSVLCIARWILDHRTTREAPMFFILTFLCLDLVLWRFFLRRTYELYISVQFSSVTQSCQTLCNSMDCSMPGLPVHNQLHMPTVSSC